ncbi:MAG: 50S ribosomal protein L29 [Patescibacteria group bacterium]|jgi:ribosomal protein L29
MTIKELRMKSRAELEKLLTEQREELRDIRFKVSRDQMKNVRSIRSTKQDIARILTILHTEKK